MERLKKIGDVQAYCASDIASSRLGIGFEKLDRDAFDPELAYDQVAALGVKWVRIQSGWAKTEKRKHEYDFAWLDAIVDNLLRRGLQPWMCLCYGNALYTEAAKEKFRGFGCPPVKTGEERTAWRLYAAAVARHFAGRVRWYEVWNEPDGDSCWSHGADAAEYGGSDVVNKRRRRSRSAGGRHYVVMDMMPLGASLWRRTGDIPAKRARGRATENKEVVSG